MAITNKDFDKNYLNRTTGGYRENGVWRHTYKYTEADREFLTCSNQTEYSRIVDGEPVTEMITLDTMKADLARIKYKYGIGDTVKPVYDDMPVAEMSDAH
jgi:hypothetical protein